MTRGIDRISLEGFKSIRSLEDLKLGAVNILIGANGCGKSNFVSFFHLLREMVEGRLEKAVNKGGGADLFLHGGPKVTKRIEAHLEFARNGYKFALEPTADNRLIFADERIEYYADPGMATMSVDRSIGEGHSESKLNSHARGGWNRQIAEHVYRAVSSWTVYHVHDTSETAAMRRRGSIRDNERLQPDAGNLAAFLYRLREEEQETYDLICETVRLVAPFFQDFLFRPKNGKDDRYLELEWKQKDSDYPFHPSQLSDGTLRFIALATALLQPDPPQTILIDEPELGLHPQALDVLADLILQARERTQVIAATQSAPLLNAFEPEQIVVIDRAEGESRFRRLEANELNEWLQQDYTLGDLWQKNVYGGGPAYE